jgi:hypothetical protein
MANTSNLGIRGTPEMRKELQRIARERNTSVQSLVLALLEDYITHHDEYKSEWDRLPALNKQGKDRVFLYANLLARLPEDDPIALAIDFILIDLGIRLDPGVVKHRRVKIKSVRAPDIRAYWNLVQPAFKRTPEREIDLRPKTKKQLRGTGPAIDVLAEQPPKGIRGPGEEDEGKDRGFGPATGPKAKARYSALGTA